MPKRSPTAAADPLFETLYAAYYASAFAVVARILDNRQDAEEAAHDVLLKARAALDDAGLELHTPQLARWVRTIARHHALDLRKQRVRSRVRDDRYAVAHTPVPEAFSQEAQIDARRAAALLRRDHADDIALIERCLFGKGDREAVARELGVTRNALNVRLHRALNRVRRAMASHVPSNDTGGGTVTPGTVALPADEADVDAARLPPTWPSRRTRP